MTTYTKTAVLRSFLLGLCLLWANLLSALESPSTQSTKTVNERLTTQAWAQLDAQDYEKAIESALDCIEQFEQRARAIQEELTKANAQVPKDRVDDKGEREKVFSRGPLNDVAACYFIIGEANRKLLKKDSTKLAAARKAFEEARKLTHARVWDSGGFFWSPAEVASDRIAILPPK